MKKLTNKYIICLTGFVLTISLARPDIVVGEDSGSRANVPQGVYIELTRDFYEALKKEGGKSYSNDPSTDYLKQISISSRFMVETNLQMLKQQDRIIQLLNSLLRKKR